MKILVTGGAGYIGSTIGSALEDRGHEAVILDSLVIGHRALARNRPFYEGDIADRRLLAEIFRDHPDIACTVHCAALISVPESVERPYDYYVNNVGKTLELLKGLEEAGCQRFVFSSSASVYGEAPEFMVDESSPLAPSSPYARTKMMVEFLIEDICKASDLRGISLRYFNPIGADPELRSGPHGKATSQVLGTLVDVSMGRLPVFRITGTDWPTRDGTGLRDYVHVWDLAKAHVNAIEQFDQVFERAGDDGNSGHLAVNLGTGQGVTVRELVDAFESAVGHEIAKVDAPRRPGDTAGSYVSGSRAEQLLDWSARSTVQQAITDALRWSKVREEVLGD
ncbi:MAG: UDP-glucose 4-epimerase GalE [SAR202 cluster bacterium]|jgi:UDP-glucose 4-epimerase|nr:UDP-glucose 4-epimerase GalE [SAR202 cluster bacterium]HAL49148.1 UDP-glucose 4-epimerase GalE [Dehalococcoidia bacterium]MDP6663877.1 UDP-glucose 4-epimerase GalE [SAR202 cluster bacterium]MDP6799652.1 UDP-glucose 4-epimerase GalE [SAR202 cluster bacterium]MQG57627.1 UDP-glucose 4-epimerase GalE [SAR202 cluster bacterium]|tara:strand:- start:1099 stop:2112 length:1014 start_codon:yes stop_codon:yes gene_type:complete